MKFFILFFFYMIHFLWIFVLFYLFGSWLYLIGLSLLVIKVGFCYVLSAEFSSILHCIA